VLGQIASLSIRNGDCDAAIVIAATTHVDSAGTAFRMKAGIASPSGRCLPFSQWADGFVPGEGAAAIVLQKYSGTMEVEPYALLRSSAVVQDGASRGFMSPNPNAQKDLLRTALVRAGCSKDDVCFIEGMCFSSEVTFGSLMTSLYSSWNRDSNWRFG
jgi:acyl transferase domain-containing protein